MDNIDNETTPKKQKKSCGKFCISRIEIAKWDKQLSLYVHCIYIISNPRNSSHIWRLKNSINF